MAFALLLATTTITLAATGVILTGSPVRTVTQPSPTAGEGLPVKGASRLLPLRAADPAGGLPWGMRVVHTTRGLVCLQIGRVYHGQLGQLGIDGSFGNDGRFHALPPEALPDVLRSPEGFSFENCAAPEDTYAGDIVGLLQSAASNPRPGVGVAADRREISFGLLGRHAVSITYRAGSETHTQGVLQGLGAYLIVQRFSSGRQLGSISETDGSDQPYPYSDPTSPNGALSSITYRYAGKVCTDTGKGRTLRACGLSERPPPSPAAPPALHEPLRVQLHIRGHVLRSVEVAFRAPYPITKATQRYDVSVSSRGCHQIGGLLGTDHDLPQGTAVSISAPVFSSGQCSGILTVEVSYDDFHDNNIQHTTIGTTTIREPTGTHLAPLPRRPR
ncbi:MAG TPA: hypothetical protein VGN25_00190 [Solirubrobacteraceae bacterium]|nr:hypothetical protein [Solirubrobacteraceae bacterium]